MAKLVDPDSLTRNTEIVITPATKTIQLIATGNLSNASPAKTSGVIGQAVYSKCKELWKSETDLNKMKFPIKMITEVKGRLINGWDWADSTTRDLLRDFGYAKMASDNSTIEESYMCALSLGDIQLDAHQSWYQQVAGFDATKTNFSHTGELNEMVKIYGDATHGNFDYTDFFKAFLRVSSATTTQYSHALNDVVVEQDLSALDYTVYKFQLDNEVDIKFTHSDSYVGSNTPYTGMSIDFIVGQLFVTATATTYVVDDVVQDGTGRWARCTTGGTVTTPGGGWASFGGTSVWEAYPGEVQIGTNYYAYNVLIDANNTTNTCTAEEIYEFCQWSLRQATDINDNTGGDGYGTVYGNVCKNLVYFIGDELRSEGGVAIEDFNPNDTNRIALYDITVDQGGLDSEDSPLITTRRTFPYVAAGDIVFSDNIVAETTADTKYTMYFKDDLEANPFDNGTAGVTSDSTTFTDSSKSWTTDALIGKTLQINEGTHNGETFRITDNDGTTLTLSEPISGTETGLDYDIHDGKDFDTTNAVIVKDNSNTDITGTVTQKTISFDYDYDNNIQRGTGSNGSDADVVIVAQGLNDSEWTFAEFTITRSTGLNFPVNCPDELNYNNPA